MKTIDFTKDGGYRLKQPTFKKMQESYFEILRAFILNLNIPDVGSFIIGGCKIVGPDITEGILYIDGDLCLFETAPGTMNSKIRKEEILASLPFKNGSNPLVFRETKAIIDDTVIPGVALSEFVVIKTDWSEIENIPQLVIDPYDAAAVPAQLTVLQRLEKLELKNAVFQAGGGMVLWNKAANLIPNGWQEVLDWKGRMPVGVDDRIDASGNSINPEFQSLSQTQIIPGKTNQNGKTATLDLENIPKHNHEVLGYAGMVGTNLNLRINADTNGPSHDKTGFAGGKPDGTTKPFSILNPYRTVLFIEFIQ